MRIPDILVLDGDERPMMIVEVRSRALEPDFADGLRDFMASEKSHDVPFGMIVDTENIRIFSFSPGKTATTLATIPTRDVLSAYKPEFGQRTISKDYLATLAEFWLQDLADLRPLAATPPEQDLFERLGILPRLKGGWTVRKDSQHAYSLY